GQAKAGIARVFMVSLSSVKRYVKQFTREGHVRPTVQRRVEGKLTKRWRKRLARQVEEQPDYTLAQQADLWNEQYKLQVSESGLSLAADGANPQEKDIGGR